MNKMDFTNLIISIKGLNDTILAQVSRAINTGLTLRNWLIGCYISEYELHGEDRAKYGEGLFKALAENLKDVSNCNRRQLYRYLRFYRLYPQIVGTANPLFRQLLPPDIAKVGLATPLLPDSETLRKSTQIDGQTILSKLSYTHLDQLVNLDDETQRLFYEIECIKGNWSVKELKRQINSLYYERSGLSKDKEKLSQMANLKAELQDVKLTIKDPYIFEWFGLDPSEVVSESQLENLLIKNLEKFLMELGNGFCFEARQKRIVIDDDQYFVDLVFYHRILKCHVLIELKLQEFNHENIGQLNTYVSWYKKNMMSKGDNPPVGILLCTERKHGLVEYALAGMDNNLFVSKYLMELPKKEDMQAFIEKQIAEYGGIKA
ncbi:MAG: PDDEXK nuclease domain-containing protein [Spirochaetaceae bacterium]|jgi:predicted nuclease of restriction endonuclease-like (RecB) superfamily|nr:PDDEXK nuclease domain-containing protein [Spirochaetaceae bacterium]